MKMSKRMLSVALTLALVVVPSLVFAESGAAKTFDSVTFNWGLTPAASSGDAESALRLAGIINEKTEGNVNVEVFPGGALGGENVMLEGLLSGTVDMANVSPNVVATIAPEMNALCLPFMYDSMEAACLALTDLDYTAKLNEVLSNYGLVYLGISYIAPRTIACNSEIHTPADVKGEVIRVMSGEIYSDIYKAWGLNTTIIAWGECYTAVQQKVCDGVDGGNEPCIDMAFYEVCKDCIQTDHVYHAQITLMSLEMWNSLTEDTRAAITQAEQENLEWVSSFTYDHWVDDTEALQKDPYNMNLIFLTPEERQVWVDASAPVYEKYKPIIGDDFYNWFVSFVAQKNAEAAK
ncbi:MAG: TRAP transporter substrate-binding protein [Clostridiales bacterium]|nr:TRAP transporter substrate-binding protein [Clostridiales bacterium]